MSPPGAHFAEVAGQLLQKLSTATTANSVSLHVHLVAALPLEQVRELCDLLAGSVWEGAAREPEDILKDILSGQCWCASVQMGTEEGLSFADTASVIVWDTEPDGERAGTVLIYQLYTKPDLRCQGYRWGGELVCLLKRSMGYTKRLLVYTAIGSDTYWTEQQWFTVSHHRSPPPQTTAAHHHRTPPPLTSLLHRHNLLFPDHHSFSLFRGWTMRASGLTRATLKRHSLSREPSWGRPSFTPRRSARLWRIAIRRCLDGWRFMWARRSWTKSM